MSIHNLYFEYEAVMTCTHNLCFEQTKEKKVYTPVKTSFNIEKWGLKGVQIIYNVGMFS